MATRPQKTQSPRQKEGRMSCEKRFCEQVIRNFAALQRTEAFPGALVGPPPSAGAQGA